MNLKANFQIALVNSLCLILLACGQNQDTTSSAESTNTDTIATSGESSQTAEPKQPNILLILADDMGLTDLGAFGSEINTPVLDNLANNGVKFTNFHASPQCAPTRSILLSGTSNHTAGLGSMFGSNFMEGDLGDGIGYEGYLHPRVATLPERLKEAGYNTYMTGKWHLGNDDEKKPTAKGFDNSFALMNGASNHMLMRSAGTLVPTYRENGEVLESLPEGFFSAKTYSDKMIEYIDANKEDGKPFFGYLALTSPHWPLQVPEEYKDLYKGRYDEGYDVLRAERTKYATAFGVAPEVDPELFEPVGKKWEELTPEEQTYSARTMELYAAMVDNMDDNIGRIMQYLKDIGEYENTLVFFMSDNGSESDSEQNTFFGGLLRNNEFYDNSLENLGNANSWSFYGPGWAQAAMAPYRMYKGFWTEGGTLVSAFVHHPTLTKSGYKSDQYLTVMDLMPTLLDLSKAEFNPTQYAGRTVQEMQGRSFLSVLQGSNEPIYSSEDVRASELHGQRALLRGDWKITWEQEPMNIAWYGDKPATWNSWKLFNLQDDPTEQFDLSKEQPELFAELVGLWDQYAESNSIRPDIIPTSGGTFGAMGAMGMAAPE